MKDLPKVHLLMFDTNLNIVRDRQTDGQRDISTYCIAFAMEKWPERQDMYLVSHRKETDGQRDISTYSIAFAMENRRSI